MLLPVHLNLGTSSGAQNVSLPTISSTSVSAPGVVNTIITPSISTTVLFGQTVSGGAVGGNLLLMLFSLNLDTLSGDQNLSLPVISSTQQFAPSVSYVVVNQFISAATAVFAPAVSHIISLPVISGTTLFAPTVAGVGDVSLPLLSTTQIFAPSVSYVVGLSFIGPTSQKFAPTVFSDNTIVLPSISSTTLYTATVAASVSLPFLSASQAFSPSIAYVVLLPFISSTAVNAPTIVKDNDLATPALISTVLYTPNLAYTMVTAFLPQTAQAFAPAISYLLQNVAVSGTILYAPSTSYVVLLPLRPSSVILYGPTVFPDGFVVLPFIAAGSVLRTPTIAQLHPDLEFTVNVVTRLTFQSKVT